MKYYVELNAGMQECRNAGMKVIRQQMVKAKQHEHAHALKERERLYKESRFICWLFNGSLSERRK